MIIGILLINFDKTSNNPKSLNKSKLDENKPIPTQSCREINDEISEKLKNKP